MCRRPASSIRASSRPPAGSIEIVIWVAVGGRGTLHGAILGAFLVNYAKSWLTGTIPELWLFALGGLFIFVTLFLPKGIVGTFFDEGFRRLRRPPAEPSSVGERRAAE